MTQRRARALAVEVIARIGLLLAVPAVLPHVFWGDVSHYVRVAQQVHPTRHPTGRWLPYRKVFWEYPPLTVPVLGLVIFGSVVASQERGIEQYLSIGAWMTIAGAVATLVGDFIPAIPMFKKTSIDMASRLSTLDGLRSKGLLTQAEYEARKQEILGQI